MAKEAVAFQADSDDLRSILEMESISDLVTAVRDRTSASESDESRHAIWIGGAFVFAEERGWIARGKLEEFCQNELGYSGRRVRTFRQIYAGRGLIERGLNMLSRHRQAFDFKVPASGVERLLMAARVAPFFNGVVDTEQAHKRAIRVANEALTPQPKAKAAATDASFSSGQDWLGQDYSRSVDPVALIDAIRRLQVVQRHDEHGYVLLHMMIEDFAILADFAELPEENRTPKHSEASSGNYESEAEAKPPYDVEFRIEPESQAEAEYRRPPCPLCGSESINKFGKIKGEQRFRCKDCGKVFQPHTPS